MQCIPGRYEDFLACPIETACVHESAFGLLEPCIRKYSTAYAHPYSHWGVTEIPADTWREIIAALRVLRRELRAADSSKSVNGLGFFFGDYRIHFHKRFRHIRRKIVRLIAELTGWLEKQLESFSIITICGI